MKQSVTLTSTMLLSVLMRKKLLNGIGNVLRLLQAKSSVNHDRLRVHAVLLCNGNTLASDIFTQVITTRQCCRRGMPSGTLLAFPRWIIVRTEFCCIHIVKAGGNFVL